MLIDFLIKNEIQLVTKQIRKKNNKIRPHKVGQSLRQPSSTMWQHIYFC